MSRICTGALVVALGSALPLGAAERVTMTVSPTRSFAPYDVVVRVHVAPDVANRAVVIVAESGDYYRSSVVQLDGESGPPMIVLELRSVPAGDYRIRAAVYDETGHELASVRKETIILDR
ncbi:MAG TPA: hypothetical protein VFP91_05220 [Vicinamibacterales bacterium]|nr:hypothetical protein [Vicinamibacterales bacterium]